MSFTLPRLLFLLFAFLAAPEQTRAAFTCNTSETGGTDDAAICAALGDFYASTNGSGWSVSGGWASAAAGVPTSYCNFRSYAFVSPCVGNDFVRLSLGFTKLAGTLPASLGSISTLTWLDLDGNALTGSVPASIGGLSSLVYADLSVNRLQGTLPESWVSLTALSTLFLATSGLCSTTGNIPGTFQPSDGPLPGCAPPPPPAFACAASNDAGVCAALGQLYAYTGGASWGSNKGWVNASAGTATDFCTFFGLSCSPNPSAPPSLTSIILQSNRLSGNLPASLSSISTLRTLRLPDNQLDGALPASLGSLTLLTSLWLYSNYIDGSIPAALGSLTSLSSLLLQTNLMSGIIPPALGALQAMTQLSLASNRLSGTLPSLLAGLTSLRLLDMRNNLLHASIPAALASLSKLDSVYLGNSGLCGAVPWAHATDDGALPACSLSPNFVCAPGYSTAVCSALGDLYASTNGSGWKRNDGWAAAASGVAFNFCAGPAWYGAQCDGSALVRLQLPANGLVGSLPASIGVLSSLQLLDLSSNALSGSCPASFASLSSLTGLTLSDSGLCGAVPSAFQPNDGRLPGCPGGRPSPVTVVVDTVAIVGGVWGAVVAVVLARKAWTTYAARGGAEAAPEEEPPPDGAPRMIDPFYPQQQRREESETFYEALAPETPEDVEALKAALLPPGAAQ